MGALLFALLLAQTTPTKPDTQDCRVIHDPITGSCYVICKPKPTVG